MPLARFVTELRVDVEWFKVPPRLSRPACVEYCAPIQKQIAVVRGAVIPRSKPATHPLRRWRGWTRRVVCGRSARARQFGVIQCLVQFFAPDGPCASVQSSQHSRCMRILFHAAKGDDYSRFLDVVRSRRAHHVSVVLCKLRSVVRKERFDRRVPPAHRVCKAIVERSIKLRHERCY